MRAIVVYPGRPATQIAVDSDEILDLFDWPSFAYPFDDPIAIVHDDNGIANHRMPNRTINGQIMPGHFYIFEEDSEGNLTGLSDKMLEKYLALFSVPEYFPPGCWHVYSGVSHTDHTTIISLKSEWLPL